MQENSKKGRKKLSAPENLPEHIERCILIGFGKAVGLSKTKIAEHLGISKPTFYKYEEDFPVLIGTFEAKARLLTSASIALQVKDAVAVKERQYLKALQNFDEFLEDDNTELKYKASVDRIDRYEGKAKQRIEQSHTTKVEATMILPKEDIIVLRSMIQDSAKLFLPAPPIIDAEVVEAESEAELIGQD